MRKYRDIPEKRYYRAALVILYEKHVELDGFSFYNVNSYSANVANMLLTRLATCVMESSSLKLPTKEKRIFKISQVERMLYDL